MIRSIRGGNWRQWNVSYLRPRWIVFYHNGHGLIMDELELRNESDRNEDRSIVDCLTVYISLSDGSRVARVPYLPVWSIIKQLHCDGLWLFPLFEFFTSFIFILWAFLSINPPSPQAHQYQTLFKFVRSNFMIALVVITCNCNAWKLTRELRIESRPCPYLCLSQFLFNHRRSNNKLSAPRK